MPYARLVSCSGVAMRPVQSKEERQAPGFRQGIRGLLAIVEVSLRPRSGSRVPPVDPTKPRRIRRLLVEPLARSEAGRWWLIHVAPRLDRVIFRLSGGRFTSIPAHILFLRHTGARSGETQENPLTYFTDGEDLIVMASNYGRERHPAWYYNVKANPEVEVRAAGRRGRYRAEIASGEDRERLWALAVRLTRAYADYEARSGRQIQVVRLTPMEGSGVGRGVDRR